eukprot:scaffold190402_cov17-Tisochrysis_lutea.AAC.1
MKPVDLGEAGIVRLPSPVGTLHVVKLPFPLGMVLEACASSNANAFVSYATETDPGTTTVVNVTNRGHAEQANVSRADRGRNLFSPILLSWVERKRREREGPGPVTKSFVQQLFSFCPLDRFKLEISSCAALQQVGRWHTQLGNLLWE